MACASKARIRNNIVISAVATATFILAVVGLQTADAQYPGQQLDYYQAMPSYTPHGIPIPGHLAAQAMQAQYQQAAYHANMANNNLQPIAESVDGEYYDESYADSDGGEARGIFAEGGWPANLMTAQRYDDHFVHLKADFIYFLGRSDSNNSFTVTNQGVGPPTMPVLRTGQTDLNEGLGGVRVAALFDPFYSFDVELAYLGPVRWGNRASVNSTDFGGPNELYGFLNNFMANRFPGTFNGTTQSISYRSALNSFELNTRFRWVHSNHAVTGAWIMGVRYLKLDERFRYRAVANAQPNLMHPGGVFDLITEADNDMVGFQIGGELLGAVKQGILFGGDIKAGVYGNRIKNTSLLHATTTAGPPATGSLGTVTDEEVAFAAEGNLMVVADVGGGMYLRGGYTALYMNGLSLGPDAMRRAALAVTPNPPNPTPLPASSGHLFTHGFFGGIEWQY